MNRMKLLLYAVCFTALVGCSPKYGVGDYYEAEGVRGVVFSVTDGGRHGKILSLEETSLPWQTGRGIDVVGAADQENGAVNLEQVKSQDNRQERFPAFAWCAGLGEGWYLPAVNEMAEINASHEAVNAALVAVQGTPLETQGVTFLYWSSTETGKYEASGGWLYAKSFKPSDEIKNYSQHVRAVRAF